MEVKTSNLQGFPLRCGAKSLFRQADFEALLSNLVQAGKEQLYPWLCSEHPKTCCLYSPKSCLAGDKHILRPAGQG